MKRLPFTLEDYEAMLDAKMRGQQGMPGGAANQGMDRQQMLQRMLSSPMLKVRPPKMKG